MRVKIGRQTSGEVFVRPSIPPPPGRIPAHNRPSRIRGPPGPSGDDADVFRGHVFDIGITIVKVSPV